MYLRYSRYRPDQPAIECIKVHFHSQLSGSGLPRCPCPGTPSWGSAGFDPCGADQSSAYQSPLCNAAQSRDWASNLPSASACSPASLPDTRRSPFALRQNERKHVETKTVGGRTWVRPQGIKASPRCTAASRHSSRYESLASLARGMAVSMLQRYLRRSGLQALASE